MAYRKLHEARSNMASKFISLRQNKNPKPPLSWSKVSGFLPGQDAFVLQALVREMNHPKDHVILEVGSFMGRSTICMAEVARHKIYAIDPHEGLFQGAKGGKNYFLARHPTYDKMVKNLAKAGATNKVEIIRKKSEDVEWNGKPIGFLFIDGIHDYTHVSYDFNKFEKHVPKGGYVGFHDYGTKGYPEVTEFVDTEVLVRDDYEEFQRTNSMLVALKIK